MLKGECHKDKFKFNYDHPDDFTKCFWQKKSKVLPTWIAYRVIICLYFFITLPFIVFGRLEKGYVWYKNILYIATLTFFFEFALFGGALGITVARFLKEKKDPTLSPLKEMPWHYKTLWFWYNMAASNAITVTLMFWLLVYNPDVDTDLMFVIASRFFNGMFLIIDYLLCAIPFRLLHIYIPCIFPLVYAIFTVIYQFSGGTGNIGKPTIYNIVDWTKPVKAIAFVIMYITVCLFSHCGMCTLYFLKVWIKKSREN